MPVFWKAAAALSLLPAFVSASDPGQRMGPGDLYPYVKQIACEGSRGSAFRIADGRFVSVAHVTSNADCAIDGQPISAAAEDGLDFAVIAASGRGGVQINCEGFVPGHYYFAVGYARGWQWQTMIRVLAMPTKDEKGMQQLYGIPQFIPGMSGGLVMDEHGAAVGTVNAFYLFLPVSLSRSLADTSVCHHAA